MSGRIFKVCYVLLLIFLPALSHAQVSKIVFTTDSQTVKPSELSGPITIQTQDSSGNLYQTPETIDLEFVSTSATAEFLGSTGNPVTKTMSKNTANRTFYYRDSSEGTFTITINAKGRESGATWSASQIITISSSLSTSTSTTSTTTTTTTITPTTSTSRTTPNTSVAISTHYSAASLTSTETDTKFEVGAGRPRMSTVGTPIEFSANTNASYTKSTDFRWSFGDGTTGTGRILAHTYDYPGEYVVVLNATAPDGIAVSRTNVSIVLADLSITAAALSYVEVTNNAARETNLYGRALVAGSKIFAFPRDTIIQAGQKISFGANVTGLDLSGQSGVSLVIVGTEVRPQEVIAKIAEKRQEEIRRLSAKLNILQDELAKLEVEERASSLAQEQKANTEAVVGEAQEDTALGGEFQTALILQSANAAEPSRPNGWLQTLKRFFLGIRD